jgi:hypothetical protein
VLRLGIGTGYDYQYLRTAFLHGNNSAVMVNPGKTTDLADTFVLNPGYVIGNIELVGPDNTSSGLEYIYPMPLAALFGVITDWP